MAETTNFSVSMDKQVKQDSEALFQDLGMNLTTAINVFLRQAIRTGGFPFEIKQDQPNKETILAHLESEQQLRKQKTKRNTEVEEDLEE